VSSDLIQASGTEGAAVASEYRFTRQLRFYGSLLLGLAILAYLPTTVSDFRLYFFTVILCFIIAAVGMNVVSGFAGQITIAQAGLMGVGAYSTALLMKYLELPYVLAIVIAATSTALLGSLVAIPALRIKGHYLALATLAIQIIIYRILANWVAVTGGPNGLRVPTPTFFGTPFTDTSKYWFVGIIALVAIAGVRNMVRSSFGRALVTMREEQLLATVMGVNATRYKLFAFGVAALYAGLAGGLFAGTVLFLDPAAFAITDSIRFLVMLIFGGLGTVVGPVIGAVLVVGAPDFFRSFEEHWALYYYITLLVFLLFLPFGITGGLQRLAKKIRPLPLFRTFYEWGVEDFKASDAAGAGMASRRAPIVGSGEPILQVRDVNLAFGGLQALKDVDFQVVEGEIAGLIGPNGAGKTTLFNVITRVLRPDTGSIDFSGQEMLLVRPHEVIARGMSRTFQNIEVCSDLTVAENVIIGMHTRLPAGPFPAAFRFPSFVRAEKQASVHSREILADLNLLEYADVAVGSLPLGIQRKVEIARALAAEPRLLLLDEPASGLSQHEAQELMSDIRRLRDEGITVIVIEHNVRFVLGLVDRVTVLDKGVVIFSGLPAEAQNNPAVIDAYLGREDDESEDDDA
jgi:ABC-type branched-subunit amino acid transport system ATPase component/ABC-type branched-subunit amino acid transport system permease subunit